MAALERFVSRRLLVVGTLISFAILGGLASVGFSNDCVGEHPAAGCRAMKALAKSVEPDDSSVATVLPHTSSNSLWESLGIKVRAYDPWTHPLPCFPPEDDWINMTVGKTPTKVGFLFVKNPKVGSSTGSGITLRMATNVAKRQHGGMLICKSRFHHSTAVEMNHAERSPAESFLWTTVRDPTSRAVSQFYHMAVSRRGVEPTNQNFIHYLEKRKMINKQLNYIALEEYTNATDAINNIIRDYDFIGVTERIDETAVALSLLLGLELQDVMYLSSAKSNGAFDDGRFQENCFRIQPSVISPVMNNYLQSPQWEKVVYWDRVLHQAANMALDKTIEKLGRGLFEENLQLFREIKQEISKTCMPKVVFPCNSTGPPVPMHETDCIHGDLGCGFDCMDEYFAGTETE